MQQPKNLLKLSLVFTAAIAAVEFAGGFVSGSISLVGDAVHVVTDVIAIGLSLFAVTLASRSHAGRMTFGYHRAEVLAALANGLSLAILSTWILYEAFQRVLVPRNFDAPIMLTVAIVGLAGNLIVVFLLRGHAAKSINIQSALVHVIYDTVSSVAVIITGVVAIFSGIAILDPLVAFVIAGLIARSAYSIVRGSTHILLEGAPRRLDIEDVGRSIRQVEGVLDVHDLHVWTISTGLDALSGHVVIKDQMLSQSGRMLEEIKRVLSQRYKITHTTIQLENEPTISFKRQQDPYFKIEDDVE
jgi:cobalt-zinc-cadmium efflux system protein